MAEVDLDTEHAKEYYDRRYLDGYMEDWPVEKKQRVAALVRELPLPKTGRALDFGCGSGVFTLVLKEALPGWQVFGTELSGVAISLARQRAPACTFLGPDELSSAAPFDFLFSHHVLEHVADLETTCRDLTKLVSPRASVLHIMPCGNDGSLERRLSQLVRNGIDPERGNRFFFEDPGHLRRLTSAELAAHFAPFGFQLRSAWFANQQWGAIDWISDLDRSFVWATINPRHAKSLNGAARLASWAVVLLGVQALKHSPSALRGIVAEPVQRLLKRRVAAEWSSRCHEPTGSEMYVFLERSDGCRQFVSRR